jgi:uncharacterized protein (TIGR00297 family)
VPRADRGQRRCRGRHPRRYGRDRFHVGRAREGTRGVLRIRAILTPGGILAALVVGIATLLGGGWPAALVLFAFFVPSVALSRLGRARKRGLVDVGKHGARDAWQVLANGGVAAICAILAWRLGGAWLAAFAGAFAAASADTWGTEIGTLARQAPRSILTFKPLATGLSGGVTIAGTLAEIAGAAIVALVAALLGIAAFVPVAIGGVAGALVDSIFGASLQSLRRCPACARDCETDPHACGTPTVARRGVAWFGNDTVNLAATLTGALVAGLLASYVPTLRP